jgi:hypothetical protein
VTGGTGSTGANGSSVLHGTAPPDSSIGNDGDFFIDTATNGSVAKFSFEP